MDREEAKNILQLCRPGNESDLNDPLIAEAFELLEQDSELQVWFEDQQAFDTQICEQLEHIEPPADLKASILAGMRAHQMQAGPEDVIEFEATPPEQPEPAHTERASTVAAHTHKAWWRNPWMGIAALFVFMVVIFNVQNGDQTQLAQNDPALASLPAVLPFLSDQIDGMNVFSFDKKDTNAHQLQSYLASTGAPSPKNMCEKLASIPTLGCVTFEFNNSKLSMICFQEGEVFHLITADAADFPDACPKSPQFYEIKDKAFKVWVEGEQLNILTIHGTKNDIPEYI